MIEEADPSAPLKRRRRRALCIAALVFFWWVLDGNLARTMLVTPATGKSWVLGTMLSSLAGMGLGYIIATGERLRPTPTGEVRGRRVLITALCAIGMVFGAMIGTRMMWRITDIVAFWGSDAPISTTSFPIYGVSVRRGRAVASIGSWGERDGLPISKNDLKFVGGARQFRRPWTYCLNLRRQEQGDMVRIWRPRSSMSSVMRCPVSVQWI